MKTELTFQKWLELYTETLRKHHNYNGEIDHDQAKDDYESGLDPEIAADDFYEEENRQD
jgi:hypothetical protein